MANNIDIYEWRSLTAAVNKIAPVNTFLLNTVFKSVVNHMSDKVDVEIVSGKQKLARFVNKNEGPQLISKKSPYTETVTLPRIYEAKNFTAEELASLKDAGASYVGSPQDVISASERRKLLEIADLDDRLTRRIEQMAALGLSTGSIAVSQSNVDFTLSFHYNADQHLKTLTGVDLWSASTAKIAQNIRTWKRQIFQLTGKNANICLLGTTAAGYFISNDKILTMLDNWNLKTGTMDLNQNTNSGGAYLGRMLGVDFYEYSLPYVDDDNAEQEAFGATRAVLLAQDDNFRLHYGPIYRISDSGTLTISNNKAMFPLVGERKTVMEWSLEAKPLPAVHNPDQVVSAVVC